MKAASAIRSFLSKPIVLCVTLYVIALTCSMAAMEIAAWATAFFLILYFIDDRFCQSRQLKLHTLGVELPFFGIIIVILIGLYLNHTDQDNFITAAGSIRNLFLIYFFAYALHTVQNLNRTMAIMITCATLIAGYAIWQHFSGVDLWTHKELDQFTWDGGSVYAISGFFSGRFPYGHSFMMFLCVPFAALLLAKRQPWWRFVLFILSFAAIVTSLFFTFARGVWLATLASLLIMIFFYSRKLFLAVVIFGAIVGGGIYKFNPALRERVHSVFTENTSHDEDRRNLWSANIEMFKDHPWVGVGYRQNEQLSDAYYKKLGIQNGVTGHAHSNYVEMLSTTGLLGFGFYMLFILAFILMTARLYATIPMTHYWHRVFALAALGAQIAFHVGGLTQWNFGEGVVQHQFLFWLAIVAYMSERYYAHIVPDDHSL